MYLSQPLRLNFNGQSDPKRTARKLTPDLCGFSLISVIGDKQSSISNGTGNAASNVLALSSISIGLKRLEQIQICYLSLLCSCFIEYYNQRILTWGPPGTGQ